MPELSQLHELSQQVRTPELGDLADLAGRRRRRRTLGLTAGVVGSAVLVAAIAVGVGGDRETTSEPVRPGPLPSPSASFVSSRTRGALPTSVSS